MSLSRKKINSLFNTDLLKKVLEFGQPWLNKNNNMIFHDPLAGVCIFQPQLCEYEKGEISIELNDKNKLGNINFEKNTDGNHFIATSVDKTKFFKHYFSTVL
ncbi:MAG: hypothetical protein ACOCP5_02580 [Halanaerobiaceae bacterium]